MTLPRIIALCGNPRSGKSTAQRMLEKHGYEVADDGRPLRDIVHQYLGATWKQVSTQEGKTEMITINGKQWMVRDALGQLGNVMEQVFGGDVICEMALRANDLDFILDNNGELFQPMAPVKREGHPVLDPTGRFSFGSVRREQGHFYAKHGGVVVEIHRTLALPSEFEFDNYSKEAVRYTIINDGDLEALEQSVATVLRWEDTGSPSPANFPWIEVGLSFEGRGSYKRYDTVIRWDRWAKLGE